MKTTYVCRTCGSCIKGYPDEYPYFCNKGHKNVSMVFLKHERFPIRKFEIGGGLAFVLTTLIICATIIIGSLISGSQ